jgi:hypothetical protein
LKFAHRNLQKTPRGKGRTDKTAAAKGSNRLDRVLVVVVVHVQVCKQTAADNEPTTSRLGGCLTWSLFLGSSSFAVPHLFQAARFLF